MSRDEERQDIEEAGVDSPLLGNGKVSKKEKEGNASFLSCVANLSNTILGTGMLAMPRAISTGGLIPGAITIIFCGFTGALGLYLLSRSAAKVGNRSASFFALSSLTFPKLAVFFDAAIALKCFGVSISYLIIIGGLMPQVVMSFTPSGNEPPTDLLDRRLWITVSMLVLIPLAFLRKIDSLRHTSYIALVAVLYLVTVVITKFFWREGLSKPGKIDLINITPSFFGNLPVYVFAFTCAQNLFSVYNELKDNSQRSLNVVIGSSMGAATVIYETVGILGYLTFGAAVGANIMESYPSSTFTSIGRVLIVILVLFSYPLQLHPCRASLDKVLHFGPKSDPSEDEDPDHSSQEIPLLKYVIMTCSILLFSFLIAINVSRLDLVLGFVGSTGSVTISFILPSVFFIALFRKEAGKKDRMIVGMAIGLLIYGVAVFVVCLTLNVLDLIKELKQPEQDQLGVTENDLLALEGAVGRFLFRF